MYINKSLSEVEVVRVDMQQDEMFMQEAVKLAAQAASEGEVPVGAVVVKDGKIVGRGRNRRETDKNALAHAEIEAINDACNQLGSWRLNGCELYVTLEPCPMCAGAIINSRLDRVVFGAMDKKAGSVGSVINMFELPYNHRPIVTVGIGQQECSEVLSNFFKDLRKDEKG